MGQPRGTPNARRQIAYVVNPTKTADLDGFKQSADARAQRCGDHQPLWFETTLEDTGAGVARRAIDAGAEMVVACGGDGTVNAVATAVVDTDVVLGIVPLGTGNLLAHNFEIPTDTEAALTTLSEGVDRRVDTGTLAGHRFLGMAGTGLDATMVERASDTAKRRVGWLAYVPPLVRSLREDRFSVTITADGQEHRRSGCVSVLFGNIGAVHGGVLMLPDAIPDDGVLDLAVVAPTGPRQWATTAARLLKGSGSQGSGITRLRAARFDVELDAPRPLEVDGEVFDDAASFTVAVDPGGLLLRMPR